jgi:hypothetical protein
MTRQVEDRTFTDLLGDVFDVRDVIARLEYLETEYPSAEAEAEQEDDASGDAEQIVEELTAIRAFLDEVRGYGGDHQWRGDWYPAGFIADSYFTTYAQQFAEDIGAIQNDAIWPATCVDWDAAAGELQTDYSSVEINGDTYWYR